MKNQVIICVDDESSMLRSLSREILTTLGEEYYVEIAESGQEALDTTLMAYRLAEQVNLPVMVVIDAFFVSHTFEPMDVPEQADVDRFLPPIQPRFAIDPQEPAALYQMAPPACYMEMRRSIDLAMDQAAEVFEDVEEEFEQVFGRRYGSIETVGCEDAEIILVTTGSATSTSRLVVENLREQGEKVGLLKLKRFRPFPTEAIREALAGARKAAILDRNFCFGVGGIFSQEIRAALCGLEDAPVIFNFIAGLGGRDIPPDLIEEIYATTKTNAAPAEKSIWVGLNEELLESCSN